MLTQIEAVFGTEANAPAWFSGDVYYPWQQVTYEGITYEALRTNTSVQPGLPGSLADWRPSRKSLALPILGVTPKDSLLVRKVTGLNPPDIDLFIGEYSRDGGTYQGRRVGSRNVVMTIDLNPNPALGETISGLRDLLYKTFVDPLVDADYLELILRDDDSRVRNLYGYVEKFETEVFEVETLVQISVVCPDPYIRDLSETVLFNESGTWVAVPFAYTGTAETGFVADIHIASNTPVLTVKNNGQAMIINHDFLTGDIVRLNTNRGQRDITYTRNNVVYPLVANVSATSRWLELHSQANTMHVHGETASDLIAGVKSLTYRAGYWGV